MPDMTGGCLCGQVRYTVIGEPVRKHLCHCRDCQRFTGSAFAAGMMFPINSVSFQGELKIYDVVGTSGQAVHRHFCPHCGSGVAVTGDFKPDIIVVQVGTLDDPTVYAPTAEIYCASALPWVHAAGGFPEGQIRNGS